MKPRANVLMAGFLNMTIEHFFVTCEGMKSVHEIKIGIGFGCIINTIPIEMNEKESKSNVSSMSLISGKCEFPLLAFTFIIEKQISLFAVLHERGRFKKINIF